jgi:hypothetical protein
MDQMLVLYRNRPGHRTRTAELHKTSTGRVNIRYVDEVDSDYMNDLIGRGVGSNQHRRRVTPDEGDLFLDAVREHFLRSTMWSLREEPDVMTSASDAGSG